jgi:hypothetical protein
MDDDQPEDLDFLFFPFVGRDNKFHAIVAENFEFDDLNNIKEIKTTYLDGGSDLIKYNYSEINPVQLVSIMQNNHERNFKYNDDGQMIKDDQGNTVTMHR